MQGIQRALGAGAAILSALVVGCASLHHYELADIDNSKKLRPFEVQVDETGLDAKEAIEVAKIAAQSKQTRERLNTAQDVIALFQVGYKTGNATFSDDWADGLLARILERCPSGQITGLNVERETMKYPVVSGEIVTVKGFCVE